MCHQFFETGPGIWEMQTKDRCSRKTNKNLWANQRKEVLWWEENEKYVGDTRRRVTMDKKQDPPSNRLPTYIKVAQPIQVKANATSRTGWCVLDQGNIARPVKVNQSRITPKRGRGEEWPIPPIFRGAFIYCTGSSRSLVVGLQQYAPRTRKTSEWARKESPDDMLPFGTKCTACLWLF